MVVNLYRRDRVLTSTLPGVGSWRACVEKLCSFAFDRVIGLLAEWSRAPQAPQ